MVPAHPRRPPALSCRRRPPPPAGSEQPRAPAARRHSLSPEAAFRRGPWPWTSPSVPGRPRAVRVRWAGSSRRSAHGPLPMVHLVHYHGVFGPHSKDRGFVVAQAEGTGEVTAKKATDQAREAVGPRRERSADRLKWAELMKKTWALDVLACACGGHKRFLCCVLRSTGTGGDQGSPAKKRHPGEGQRGAQKMNCGPMYVSISSADCPPPKAPSNVRSTVTPKCSPPR